MSDDFLHRLRVQPPLEFTIRLAANLQVLPGATRSARRFPIRRAWPVFVLLAGAAFAAASPEVRTIVFHAWSTLFTTYSSCCACRSAQGSSRTDAQERERGRASCSRAGACPAISEQ